MNKHLVNVLFNLDKINTTCFLCFKTSNAYSNIYETFKIWDDEFEYSVSVFSIVKSLYPTFDIIVRQCCEDCSSCLIKTFIKFQQNQRYQNIILSVLESITSEIKIVDLENIYGNKILLKLCKYVDTCEKPKQINDSIDILQESLYECKICRMKFDANDELNLHCDALHPNKNNTFICDICGKLFKSSTAMQSHVHRHKDKKCPYCLKLLKNTSHFKMHLQKHKNPNVTKKITNKTIYRCNDCMYTSFNKKSLEAHMHKVHLNVRPYKCSICQKGFYKTSNLTEHMAFVHSTNCSVICEHCGDKFSSNKTLERHLRIHTNEKPFQCNVCGLKFITSGRRTEHMKRKHLPKTESCHFCNKQFSLKKDLNSHVKNIHC